MGTYIAHFSAIASYRAKSAVSTFVNIYCAQFSLFLLHTVNKLSEQFISGLMLRHVFTQECRVFAFFMPVICYYARKALRKLKSNLSIANTDITNLLL